jgi:PEGA domain
MTLTGQLRLFEADEIGDKYKVSGRGAGILKIVIAAVLAISAAAGVTFFIIKSTRDTTPTVGTIRVESVPAGAQVTYDGVRIAGSTPLSIDSVPVGTRHEVKVELAKHKAYIETVDIPKRGGEVPVKAVMDPITGKLRVLTSPDGADIYIDGQLRGRAPMTITGIDMSSAKVLELRLKDHLPVRVDLTWPGNGEININEKLVK